MSLKLPEIIDSHCHLDSPELFNDLNSIIVRARKRGVTKVVTICTKEKDLQKIINIVEEYPEIFFAFGLHPMSVSKSENISLEKLIEVSNHPKMIGIGETGLDYHYNSNTKELQKESLLTHIVAARKTKLPLIIHSRKADGDMKNILQAEFTSGAFDCVMHCFSSGENLALECARLGFYLSMSGIITFPKSLGLREIFSKINPRQVLLETDSPYLAPVPYRGKTNEPSYTADTAKVGAKIYNLDEGKFRELTTENFHSLFKKVKR